MTNTENFISQWIPVVGVLLGAGIGFAASFFTMKFNKDKDERLSRESRDRDRVEKIYQLLITINSEKATQLTAVLNSIHHARPILQKATETFPPLLELEMLINLYFSSMEIQRQNLMTEIQSFGEKYFEYGFKDYRKESPDIKKCDSGVLVELQFKIDNEIKVMQKLLVDHVKA